MKNISITDHQNAAIRSCVNWFKGRESQVFYLGGSAGTGKSTILPFLMDSLGLQLHEVALCAYTGKASNVMLRKLRDFIPSSTLGLATSTIHSLMYLPVVEDIQARIRTIEGLKMALGKLEKTSPAHLAAKKRLAQAEKDLKRFVGQSTPDFNLRGSPYRYDIEGVIDRAIRAGDEMPFTPEEMEKLSDIKLIIVDEASMVGREIAHDLKRFSIPILAIGDPAQLSPVADTAGLTNGTPDFFLTEVHRQALDNPIIRVLTKIREGGQLTADDQSDKVKIVRRRDDIYTRDLDLNAKVICGTNVRRWNLTTKIRQKWCAANNLPYTTGPHVGEPMLICKNDRRIGVINGGEATSMSAVGDLIAGDPEFIMKIKYEDGREINTEFFQGTLEEHIERRKGAFTAHASEAFDAKNDFGHIDYGWVITCHKAQGSQYKDVVVHDESSVFRTDATKWLYTACSRAEDRLFVVT